MPKESTGKKEKKANIVLFEKKRKREKGKTAIKSTGMFVSSHGKVIKLDLHRMCPRGTKSNGKKIFTALHEVMLKSYAFC